jgi:hypothetical protein
VAATKWALVERSRRCQNMGRAGDIHRRPKRQAAGRCSPGRQGDVPARRREEAAEIDRMGAAIFWGMAAFWGFVWPWLMIALHKPFAKRCLNRVLAEVDSHAA